ncbi:MAG: hypothetical protein NC453_26375, partial [Muribaculum sp.]|nr:hypothetical protein [Muribaculum sp.]
PRHLHLRGEHPRFLRNQDPDERLLHQAVSGSHYRPGSGSRQRPGQPGARRQINLTASPGSTFIRPNSNPSGCNIE